MAALIPVAFHAFVQTLIACGAPISAGVEAFAHACRATIVFLLVPFIPDAINLFQTIASAGMTILPLIGQVSRNYCHARRRKHRHLGGSRGRVRYRRGTS